MTTRRQLIAGCGVFVLLLAVAVSLGYGALLAVKAIVPSLASLGSEVLAALVATFGTIVAAVATVVYSQSHTKRMEIAESHRPRKVEVYSSFMEAIVEVLQKTRRKELDGITEDEAWVSRFVVFKRDLIVWGSPGVINAYQQFERNAGKVSTRETILLMDAILREIRKDLGNRNLSLKPGALIQLFLTDRIEDLK